MNSKLIIYIFVLCLCIYVPIAYSLDHQTKGLIIAPSAKGWDLKNSVYGDSDSSTVLINPNGNEYDIGQTLFLNCPKTIIWSLEEPSLLERFLIIYFHPSASGAVPMYIFHLNTNNIPTLSAVIYNHYELDVSDEGSIARCSIADGGYKGKKLAEVLFVDSDNDNVVELKDNDISAHGGKITFYKWEKTEKIFKPLWVETYIEDNLSEMSLRLKSREYVKETKTRSQLINLYLKARF